jgi:helix-turn-helix protein
LTSRSIPEVSIAVRERSSAAVLRKRIGGLADDPGLVDADGGFTDAGRDTRERIEAVTDELAAPAYDVLSDDELAELIAGLEPIAAAT